MTGCNATRKPRSSNKTVVWKEISILSECVRAGNVTIVIGEPGSGKTVATSILAKMAEIDGREVRIVGRDDDCYNERPVEPGEIAEVLNKNVKQASNGALVIAQEVFEEDQIDFYEIMRLAYKRKVTTVVEVQSADLNHALDVGCDVLMLRVNGIKLQRCFSRGMPSFIQDNFERIDKFRRGQGLMVYSNQNAVRWLKLEMPKAAQKDFRKGAN